MDGRGKENLVQAAISFALELYCNMPGRPQLRQFPPYPNQQGTKMRQYCGDIIGMLDDAKLILLEIKERDCEENILRQFDARQFHDNLKFQRLGIPIAYAYNLVPLLEYYRRPRQDEWPKITLQQINRATPRELPGMSPSFKEHESLLSWIERQCGEDATLGFGRIHGALRQPDDLRNGILVLLHGVTENTIAALNQTQLNQVVKWLSEPSWLNTNQYRKMQAILGESAEVFRDFVKTSPPSVGTLLDEENTDNEPPAFNM